MQGNVYKAVTDLWHQGVFQFLGGPSTFSILYFLFKPHNLTYLLCHWPHLNLFRLITPLSFVFAPNHLEVAKGLTPVYPTPKDQIIKQKYGNEGLSNSFKHDKHGTCRLCPPSFPLPCWTIKFPYSDSFLKASHEGPFPYLATSICLTHFWSSRSSYQNPPFDYLNMFNRNLPPTHPCMDLLYSLSYHNPALGFFVCFCMVP